MLKHLVSLIQFDGFNLIFNAVSKPKKVLRHIQVSPFSIWGPTGLNYLPHNTWPILFLIFINDLYLVLKYCKADLYADDATFHTQSNIIHTFEHILTCPEAIIINMK